MHRIFIAITYVDAILSKEDPAREYGGSQTLSGLLSPRELAVWSSLRHPVRKQEWLVARLLAKHAVLSGAAIPLLYTGEATTGQPVIRFVRQENILDDISPLHRQIELVCPVRGKMPKLHWYERDVSPAITCSVSHSGGWVAVALTQGNCLIGLDIERIQVYSEEFRTSCFSTREQNWIALNKTASSLSCRELSTLSWTLKESAFKADGDNGGSLLQTEIDLRHEIEGSLPRFSPDGEPSSMVCFDLAVFNGKWRQAQGASCRIGEEYILSIVTIPKGEYIHHAHS